MIFKNTVHYFLHFILPLIISYYFFRNKWKTVYLIFLLSMLVDLDHLFASPIFDKNRCSINFHLLHSYFPIMLYTISLCFRKTRIIAIALILHMITDYMDCYL